MFHVLARRPLWRVPLQLQASHRCFKRCFIADVHSSRKHRISQVWSDGKVGQWEGTSRELMSCFGLVPRDLRLLATRGANLSIRPEYFMFRLPPFAGCVWSEQVLILSEDSGRAAELLKNCLLEDMRSSKHEQPFEFMVLEMALRESLIHKQDRFARLSVLIASSLRLRTATSGSNLAVRDFLVPPDSRATREHALYRLLMLSNSLSALEVDVRRQYTCLDQLLKSDEDMAAMYLSYRRASGSGRNVADHEDMELMLESFGMQLEDLLDRIQKLQESVTTQRKLEQLRLTSERNRIMRLELLMGMGTAALAVSTVVAGFFGMNLQSGIEDVPGLFWMVTAGTTAITILIFAGLMSGVRRFHRVQRNHMSQTGSLRRALEGLDEAYFSLRQSGSLVCSEDEAAPSGVNKAELFEALEAAGCVLNDEEQDVLWEAMDANRDGSLSASELGMFSAAELGLSAGEVRRGERRQTDQAQRFLGILGPSAMRPAPRFTKS
eukprot:gb/GFBE01032931.1/.p1 GENE.gb/GFBE01032931.1/~~gb/GFBE01032931.1/.p1  ORF type:complete len:494 (+),score=106.57 gb/GFBE01032931.1/:1-1482(+)